MCDVRLVIASFAASRIGRVGFFRKVALCSAVMTLCTGLLMTLPATSASAATPPFNASGSVSCTGMVGSLKFVPPLTSNGGSNETATVKTKLVGCSGDNLINFTGKVSSRIALASNSCSSFTGSPSATGSLTVNWSAKAGKANLLPTTFTLSEINGMTVGSNGEVGIHFWNQAASGSFTNGSAELTAEMDSNQSGAQFSAACSSTKGLKKLPLVAGELGPPVHTYWADSSNNTIGEANLDGTGVNQNFISAHAIGLAVYGGHIYWGNGVGGIGRANLDGTGVNNSFIVAAPNSQPWGVAVYDGHIYWANDLGGTIGEANLDGTGVNLSFISGLTGPNMLAVYGAHIYWTTIDSDEIGEANLDGTAVNNSFISAAPNSDGAEGLAIYGGHIYWGNVGSGTIGEANLDGTGVNQNFITTGANTAPWGIAFAGRMFYTVVNLTTPNTSTIGEANVDGTDTNNSFITGANYPVGIAIG
jgi:virginiamycin B lyase